MAMTAWAAKFSSRIICLSEAIFNFHIPRAQQCQQLAVSCRLSLGTLAIAAGPPCRKSRQRRDELAIQLLAMTRADRTAGYAAGWLRATFSIAFLP